MYAKMPVFPLSGVSRTFAPGLGCNVVLILTFMIGVGLLALGITALSGDTAQLLTPITMIWVMGGLTCNALFVIGILSLVSLFTTWNSNRAVRQITEKQLWAVWQYAPDEWQTLAKAQTQYEQGFFKFWHSLIGAGIILGIFTAMGISIDTIPLNQRLIYPLIGVFMALFVLGSGAVWKLRQQVVVRQNHQRRIENFMPRLYVSPGGVYHETEGYLVFRRLRDLRLTERDSQPYIIFMAEFPGRYGYYTYPVTLPIPRAALSEARSLISQFRQSKR